METITPSTPVAILGLGIIGSRIAKHLKSNGWNIIAWNRTPNDDCPNDVATPAEAAKKAKVICLFLKNREACHDVLKAMSGELSAEHIIINHSTIDVKTAKDLARECSETATAYWDAPFTGSKIPAENGQLCYYLSAPAWQLKAIRPLLEASSREIIEFGSGIGKATAAKLATNLVSAVTVQALSEALALVKANGMTANDLLKALSVNVCDSALAHAKIPAMDTENFTTNFSLDNMRKDSVYVRELAREEKIATPAIDLVSKLMQDLCNKGHAEEDFAVLAIPTTTPTA